MTDEKGFFFEVTDKKIRGGRVRYEKLEEQYQTIVHPAGIPPERLVQQPEPKHPSEIICGKKCDIFDLMKDVPHGLRCYDILNRMETDPVEYLRFMGNLGLHHLGELTLFGYLRSDQKNGVMKCLREKIIPWDEKRRKDVYTHNEDSKKTIKVSPSLLFLADAENGDTVEVYPQYPTGGYGVLEGTASVDKKIIYGVGVHKDVVRNLFGISPPEGKSLGALFTLRKKSNDPIIHIR